MNEPVCELTAAIDDPVSDAAVAAHVQAFYELHPYPPPVSNLTGYGAAWNSARRRAEAHLVWPNEPYREDRRILIAGCGTSQAAKHALRWPKAQVTGIDFAKASIDATAALKRKHSIHNLDLVQLPIERARDLGRTFDLVVCTGVLHHLADPIAGLRALRDVIEPDGAIQLMTYAPYGRAGIYMLQDYCRRLGIGTSTAEKFAIWLRASLPCPPTIHCGRSSSRLRTSKRRPASPTRCSTRGTGHIRCRRCSNCSRRATWSSADGSDRRLTWQTAERSLRRRTGRE